MGHTKGSRNKTTLVAQLKRQTDLQDEGHLNKQNNNVLAVISEHHKENTESE